MNTRIGLLIISIAIFMVNSSGFAFQFQFTPRVSSSETYTDNVFLTDRNEEDDYITTVSAGFTAELIGKTGRIEVSYDPAYEFYDDFDELDGWSHDARLFARSDLTRRTSLQFVDRFLRTRDPLSDQDIIRDGQVVIEGDTTSRISREEYYRNTATARLTHQFGVDDLVYTEFLYGLLRNDDPQDEDNDRYEPSIGLNYWFGPKFGVETRGVYTRGEYDQDSDFVGTGSDDFDNLFGSIRLIRRTTRTFSFFGQYDHIYRDYEGNENDYQVYQPSAGLIYAIERDLIFRFGLGYFYQDIDSVDNDDGVFINSEVNKSWNFKRGFIRLIGAAGLDQNNFGAQNIDLERFGSIRTVAGYNFTRNFLADISGYYRYSDPINTDDPDDIEEQNRFQFGAGLAFLPLRWMELKLDYRFNKLDQKGGGDDDYDENRVMFTLTLQPGQPWKF